MIRMLFDTFLRRHPDSNARVSMDAVLEQADRHIHNLQTVIPPAPESKHRTRFDTNLPREKISMMNLTPKQRLKALSKGAPLFINMRRAARAYDTRVPPAQSEASPAFIARLEALAHSAGARDIGYVRVPRNAIFQDKGIPCEYAIVFTVEMDKAAIETAPSFECQLEVMDGYKRMSQISIELADMLRENGFAAYPGMALGGLTDYVHLAELAGLGAIGYHGLLIAPGEGARLRINTIYTNITNLPTLDAQGIANEHLWVRDFCAMCKKCVRQCPAKAIYDRPQPRGDGGMQCIDHDACRDYFASNFGCAVCLAVCPFSHSGYDAIKKRFKGNGAAPQFRIPS